MRGSALAASLADDGERVQSERMEVGYVGEHAPGRPPPYDRGHHDGDRNTPDEDAEWRVAEPVEGR